MEKLYHLLGMLVIFWDILLYKEILNIEFKGTAT